MADPINLPDASVPLILNNRMHPDWYRIMQLFAGAYNATNSAVSSGDTGLATKAAKAQTFWGSYPVKFPEDETVILIPSSKEAFSVTETVTQTEVGTATVTLNINGTPLGGAPNSASTSENVQAHASANAVAVGDQLSVTFSSTSSDCENLALQFSGPIVLA
jgi:hypothetical protein